jgi:hypothetical protein
MHHIDTESSSGKASAKTITIELLVL